MGAVLVKRGERRSFRSLIQGIRVSYRLREEVPLSADAYGKRLERAYGTDGVAGRLKLPTLREESKRGSCRAIHQQQSTTWEY